MKDAELRRSTDVNCDVTEGAGVGSILNDDDRTAICQRIGSVTSASVPRWGQMDAKAMLTHLRLSALMALGELPVANTSRDVDGNRFYFHTD